VFSCLPGSTLGTHVSARQPQQAGMKACRPEFFTIYEGVVIVRIHGGRGLEEHPRPDCPDDACTPISPTVQTPYGAPLCEIHESHDCLKPVLGELIWGASAGVPASLLRE
jgi:hypothetical protein